MYDRQTDIRTDRLVAKAHTVLGIMRRAVKTEFSLQIGLSNQIYLQYSLITCMSAIQSIWLSNASVIG